MSCPIAPDTTKPAGRAPTHFHCYRWSGAGREWERLGKTDTLDLDSPDHPPVRTVDWLVKSPRFIAAVHIVPVDARDWLIAEWDRECRRAMYASPTG
ncbi:hypothetical protein [Actinomadura decatromicini]|uniref:Uncharacterized protein n=1 Tax=Actinomadura decatromicini TaxID=2604572 RepID=A0A5D3FQY4_9ACTN|nr:hypothetical protein [Actinomadura decatromicini]TYK50454.1 hypothetical protein FXF68_07945 [Actinomadura decatromicini]